MTEQDVGRMKAGLTSWLRCRGELLGSDEVSDDAIARWLNAAGIEESVQVGLDYIDVRADLESWWASVSKDLRWFVLQGLRQLPDNELITTGEPPWWPVYEQWLEVRVRPWIETALEGALHEQKSAHMMNQEIEDAASAVMHFTRTDRENALQYLMGERLRIPAVTVSGPLYGHGAPRLELHVASPLIEAQFIKEVYELHASRLRQAFRPPAVESKSVAFYLAYDSQIRAGVRDKAARLAALPEELRSTRDPNSAAAFHGKLKKRFREAFEISDGWLQMPEVEQDAIITSVGRTLTKLRHATADYDEQVKRQHDTIRANWTRAATDTKGGETP